MFWRREEKRKYDKATERVVFVRKKMFLDTTVPWGQAWMEVVLDQSDGLSVC
jgi:hypothetical protein